MAKLQQSAIERKGNFVERNNQIFLSGTWYILVDYGDIVSKFSNNKIKSVVELRACIDGLYLKCNKHSETLLTKEIAQDVKNITLLVEAVCNFCRNVNVSTSLIYLLERTYMKDPMYKEKSRIQVALEVWNTSMKPSEVEYKPTTEYQRMKM
eukprot:TRINITY_DN775_c0_g1_i2.p1 TRINITY_DN775_c0_g1~~TRINITY_DN775_c0_g1_i2.p1  ORF type:complete len:170 (-),score=8.61 TRINITY_DN775_c0_g1_i2:34-489(-)